MARVRTVPDRQEAPKECSGSRRNEDRSKEKSPEKKQNKNHDELKHLHDSLSTFFTPSGGGRRRVAPKKFGEEDETKEESSEEKPARSQDMKPLTIDTNCDDGDTLDAPVVSPARRICEKLMDSLSPYFSATSEKRTHRRPSRVDGFFFPGESGTVDSEEIGGASSGSVPKKMKSRKGEDLKKVVGTRKTQNSASAALFGSPVDDAARTSSDTDTASNRGTKKSTRLRVPKQEPADDSYLEISPPPAVDMSQRKKRKTTDVSSPNIREKENVNWETFLKNGEVPVDDEAIARSEKARKDAQAGIDEAIKKLVDKDDPRKEPHWPRSIVLGSKQMKTWYSSPFPQEFASNPVLHICEFCLKYKKTASAIEHHREKCTVRCPPGNEIYRHNKTSVFEVDGNISSEYCQNLCLIAKLFIDHKTLYYDVEPFLFYIVTKNDQYGNNIVGYFSKEKYNNQNWNLSCIVTLPCYQKSGFGRFLIDFSYLLSRKAGRLGTPERPLSNAGRVSYASYWKSAILEWIYANMEKLKKMSLQEIANGTGIALHDVVETLDNLEWFQRGPDGMELAVNWSTVEAHHKLTRSDRNRIWLIETSLKWAPVQYSPSKDFPVRSPVRLATPHRSPCTANVGSTPSGVSIAAVGSTIKKGSGTPKSFKKKAARRKLTLVNRKEHPPSSSDSLSSDDEVKPISKEPNDALFESPDSGSEMKKAENTGLIGRQTNNSASTSATFTRRANRGKGIYEDDDRSSASSLSSDDDKDTSYSLGGSKGKKGKPQKGKGLPPPRKRRPPAKKSGKSPGKVFPPNYGTVDTAAGESTSFPRCDSAASSATVPMRQDDPSTPGGGRTFDDVDEYRPALSSFCDQAPSTSTPTSHSLSRSRIARDHRSTSLSTPTRSPVRSPVTDSSISRPHTPLTRMSRCSTPITDSLIHHQQQQLIMNMGGIPDDEEISSRSRAASVESDRPPQLQAVSGASSDEAPPILPNESHNDTPPILTAAGGYNSDDDDAPPQLSPVVADTIDAEPDPDKPPMVPLTEEQRQLAAMDQPPRAPIKKIDEETMNSFDTSAQSIMEPSSSTSMLAQTPQNTYPGSLKQNTTPGSVPSSGQMPNHTTPEMQQSFMSPGLQPGSVSSVHGVPPNATIDQGWAPPAPLSNPATPLRHSAGPFGSPQGPVQIPGAVQPLRASIDAPTSSKRSGESSRSKRTQQQQQAHQLQQQQQQFAAVHQAQFPMQMNPLNPYMQSQYPGTYPTAPGTYGGFDPTAYPPGNTFWQNYTPNYTKTNGSTGMERADEQRVFLPNMMPPAAMMYPNYPNGVNGMMQNAYRNVYPNPAAFNNTPNQFPPSFPLNSFQCHPNQFFGYHK